MRLKLTVLPFLLLFLLTLSMPAGAKEKESEHITISDPVMVAGTELKAGDYHVFWEGAGPTVQVMFKRGDKAVVTTSATLVNEPSIYDGAVQMKSMVNNTRVLQRIAWKKKALVFDQSSSG